MIEMFGFPALVLVGVVLGAIGAGGSILAVPILVYLFGVAPSIATGYSLLIVGTTALVGAIAYVRRRQSDPRTALVFGLPAIAAVYLTRRSLFPAIPDPVFAGGGVLIRKDAAVMVLFAMFAIVAAASMLRGSRDDEVGRTRQRAPLDIPLLASLGFGVGILTGLVGAGGGFMILPVLVLLGGLPMRVAIGTDLIIIAAKSLLGFVGEMQAVEGIDYGFVVLITLLPLAGMSLGMYLNRRLAAPILRTAFGWFVLAMGGFIIVREVFLG
jgi:uncharacterized membrane protein YfcA